MELLSKLLVEYVNREPRERTKGRYYASEINAIIRGYKRPEDFFKHQPIDELGAKRILTGVAMEDMLTKIIGERCKPQEKREIKIAEGIVIVCKPDYVYPDFVLETKANMEYLKYLVENSNTGRFRFKVDNYKIEPFDFRANTQNYQHQLEVEFRAFNKPVKLGLFKLPFDVEIIDFKPSLVRWENIKKKIIQFHLQVCQIQNATSAGNKKQVHIKI